MISLRLSLSIVALVVAGRTDEALSSDVHVTIVDAVTDDIAKAVVSGNIGLDDFTYVQTMDIGPITSQVKLYFYTGDLLIRNLERAGFVSYVEKDGYSTFSFSVKLGVFFAYRYRLTASGSPMSSGTTTSDTNTTAKIVLKADSQNCVFTFDDLQLNTNNFDVAIVPSAYDVLFPATFHLLQGNALQKNIEKEIRKLFNNVISKKSVCDYFKCYSEEE